MVLTNNFQLKYEHSNSKIDDIGGAKIYEQGVNIDRISWLFARSKLLMANSYRPWLFFKALTTWVLLIGWNFICSYTNATPASIWSSKVHRVDQEPKFNLIHQTVSLIHQRVSGPMGLANFLADKQFRITTFTIFLAIYVFNRKFDHRSRGPTWPTCQQIDNLKYRIMTLTTFSTVMFLKKSYCMKDTIMN